MAECMQTSNVVAALATHALTLLAKCASKKVKISNGNAFFPASIHCELQFPGLFSPQKRWANGCAMITEKEVFEEGKLLCHGSVRWRPVNVTFGRGGS